MLTFKFLRRIVKRIDLLPLNFKFSIKDHHLKRTFFGGLLSIIQVLIIIYVIVKNYVAFLSWDDPIVRNFVDYIANNPSENITLEDMEMVHTIINPLDLQTIRSNLSFNSSENIFVKLTGSEKTAVGKNIGNFLECSDSKIKNLNKSLYEEHFNIFGDNSSSLCFLQTDEQFKLGGNPIHTHEETYNQFIVDIDLCSIDEAEDICLNDTIWKMYSFIYSFSLKDTHLNISNPKGYESFFYNYNFQYSFDKDLEIKIKIVKNVISSDLNLIYDIFPNEEIIFYSFSDISVASTTRNSEGSLRISLKMKLDEFQNIYKRRYIKIDEALASILSIYSIISFLCQMSVDVLEYGTLDDYFIKKLYYFVPINDQTKPNILTYKLKTSRSLKVDSYSNYHNSQEERKLSYFNVPFKRNYNSEDELNKNNQIINENNKIKTYKDLVESKDLVTKWKHLIEGDPPSKNTLKLMINDLFSCLSKLILNDLKKTIIAREYLKMDFNVINILQKLLEFEKLKEIILNEKQMEIFKLCYKRIIDLNIENNRDNKILDSYDINLNPNSKKSIEKISSSYRELSCSNDIIDKKLVDFLYFIKN